MQDGYLSPGEAKRLHTMSTTVPLPSPGLESDSEPEAHEAAGDDMQANGKRVTPDTDGAASDGDWIQTSSIMTVSSSSSSSSGDSYIDDGSDVSVISGMRNSDDDSIAPTEVMEDEEQDATIVLGESAYSICWIVCICSIWCGCFAWQCVDCVRHCDAGSLCVIEFMQLSVAVAIPAAFDCIGICGESVSYSATERSIHMLGYHLWSVGTPQ